MPPPGPSETDSEDVVLVLTAGHRDAQLTCKLLGEANIAARPCEDIVDLAHWVERGAGAALVSEEALARGGIERLHEALLDQPPWSDFPIVIFGDPRTNGTHLSDRLGNVTLVDRPVQVRTMIASARAALRSRQRQYEARRAIELRDQFLAMLGHELRNPLAAVLLATDLMGRTQDKALLDEQRAVLKRQGRHLARLVDDLLDVARVTHGKIVLDRTTIDLAEVVQACVAAALPTAQAAGLSLASHLGNRPVWISGDRVRLEQVFNNLVHNAIKYTPARGAVDVTVVVLDERVEVRIVDTGVGIAPEMLPQIFNLFSQADRSLDRAQGGLGLGLTVVRSLVRLHGGSIEAKSDGLGSGTRIRVSLPCVAAPAALVEPAVSYGGELPPRRVVVVEDNDDIRALLAETIAFFGHEVATAADGPSGLELVARNAPDIAFVDIGLPGFDGFELARRARARGVDSRLVALTGYGRREDQARALEAGFDLHVTKPVNEQVLEDIFARLAADRTVQPN